MVISETHVEKIRGFNRFYTQILGLLDNRLLKSDYSLVEARILFELGRHPDIVSKDLVNELRIDPAYLSRILKRFEKQDLIQKKTSPSDTRKQMLSLTPKGNAILLKLQEMSNSRIKNSLSHLTDGDSDRLLNAMETIEQLFTGKKPGFGMITIRSHRPGDLGYITYRHAVFYSKNYGFDSTFDAYVASGLSDFITRFDPQKEHLWVAETDTTPVGSIAIVKKDETTAQLRWFLVEPEARGKGLGKKLLSETIAFCHRKNYRKIILWTVSNLDIARKLYKHSGFTVSETQTHEIWGQTLTEEMWTLHLENPD